jgi:hypothetical protein
MTELETLKEKFRNGTYTTDLAVCLLYAAKEMPGTVESGLAELAALRAELEAENKRANLHADLNRRAAQALGKPECGNGSTWHDIPEWITRLRAERDALRAAAREVLSQHYRVSTATRSYVITNVDARDDAIAALAAALEGVKP